MLKYIIYLTVIAIIINWLKAMIETKRMKQIDGGGIIKLKASIKNENVIHFWLFWKTVKTLTK